jgi:hypothetical protein
MQVNGQQYRAMLTKYDVCVRFISTPSLQILSADSALCLIFVIGNKNLTNMLFRDSYDAFTKM